MVSGIIKNCDVDFTIFGSCHGTAECGILFAMKAFWIVMGFLVLTGGCGLFTPIEELQRQARERNGSASNDVVVVQAVAEKANPEAKEIETEPPEEEVDYPLVDIASSRLHPRKGDIFRFDGSCLI